MQETDKIYICLYLKIHAFYKVQKLFTDAEIRA
jgi:hypothetical protein